MPRNYRVNDLIGSKDLQKRRNVFVVHGRNEAHRESVANVIGRLNYKPIILDEQPHGGKTIVEKFEVFSDVVYAVVLLSADDRGGLASDRTESYSLRARQNVILELGFFWGKLGRSKVCALYDDGVESPSDYTGVGFIKIDTSGRWKNSLAAEMKNAGLNIDLNRI